jgi:hypothetical protein
MLARHAGASRFACNQCLQFVIDALEAKRADPQARVPWSRFDLINGFNAWKHSQAAGRVFVTASDGIITEQVTGLAWRHAVSAQVFEEARDSFRSGTSEAGAVGPRSGLVRVIPAAWSSRSSARCVCMTIPAGCGGSFDRWNLSIPAQDS